jgi:NAD+ dependent glucose-6-phosphate dehydrogenase
MATVGITGSAGTLGRVLVQGLRARYPLRLFDRHGGTGSHELEHAQLDLADAQQVDGAFEGLDVLLHIAGNPSPSAPRADTLRDNHTATSLVFEEARKARVKRIVFASSNFYHQKDIADALRARDGRKIGLNAYATPACPYAESKVYGENLGFHYTHLGLTFVALRIGWCVPEDNPRPYDSPYMRAMFCSQRDLVQSFERAIQVDLQRKFLAAFAISNNRDRLFDLTETRSALGYDPQDDAQAYLRS